MSKIKDMRLDKKWTQAEYAELTGLRQRDISNIERQENLDRVPVSRLKQLAKPFNVPFYTLASDDFVPVFKRVGNESHHEMSYIGPIDSFTMYSTGAYDDDTLEKRGYIKVQPLESRCKA